jgi:hypothetical protein
MAAAVLVQQCIVQQCIADRLGVRLAISGHCAACASHGAATNY